MKKVFIIISFVISLVGVFLTPTLERYYRKKNGFMTIPISFVGRFRRPVVLGKIEGQKYKLLIDLGCANPIELQPRCFDQIQYKIEIPACTVFDINGISHISNGFHLKKVSLGKIKVTDVDCFVDNESFIRSAKYSTSNSKEKEISERLANIDGRIGYPIFEHLCCYFQVRRSKIHFARSVKDFTFDSNKFHVVDLHFNKWWTIDVQTDFGLKRFLLDSGSTRSVLRSDTGVRLVRSNLKVGNLDLGNRKILLYPINERYSLDGILGMDFFQRHDLVFDFKNRKLFIEKNDHKNNMFFPSCFVPFDRSVSPN